MGLTVTRFNTGVRSLGPRKLSRNPGSFICTPGHVSRPQSEATHPAACPTFGRSILLFLACPDSATSANSNSQVHTFPT